MSSTDVHLPGRKVSSAKTARSVSDSSPSPSLRLMSPISSAVTAEVENRLAPNIVPKKKRKIPAFKKTEQQDFGLLQPFAKLFTKDDKATKAAVFCASGLDAWVPADCGKVVLFPTALYKRYTKVYPPSNFTRGSLCFHVVIDGTEETAKRSSNQIHHLVLITRAKDRDREHHVSLYREKRLSDVIALYERCTECKDLFRVLAKTSLEQSLGVLSRMMVTLKAKRLWTMEHIAVECGMHDYFAKTRNRFPCALNVLCRPEGLSPLIMAVQRNDQVLVKRLITLGADMTQTDMDGNNVLHHAAKTTPNMITVLWNGSPNTCRLLNQTNAEGVSPLYTAWCHGCGRCATALFRMAVKQKTRSGLSTDPSPTIFDVIGDGLRLLGMNKAQEEEHQWNNPLLHVILAKNSNIRQIKAILEKYPDSFREIEPVTGNSILHYASNRKPLVDLLDALGNRLDVNLRNAMQRTPLHMLAHRNDLSLIMPLLGYEVLLNAKDNEGNTALHIAASNLNVDIVRVLLCFGANPNIINHYDETPRHLAAKHKGSAEALEIVRGLVMFGAKFCSELAKGCTAACSEKRQKFVENSTNNAKRRNSSHRLDSGANLLPETPDEDDDELTAINLYIEEEVEAVSRLYDEPQRKALLCVREQLIKLKEMKAEEERRREKRVCDHNNNREADDLTQPDEDELIITALSLDGGGTKGMISSQMLVILQRFLPRPLHEYIDWIAATSTGTYSAAYLSSGFSLAALQRGYLRVKDQVFAASSRPYNSNKLISHVQGAIGTGLMSEIPYPRLAFTTMKSDFFPCQLAMTRNYRLPLKNAENEELGFEDPTVVQVWKACHRSAAAPTYFGASEGKYLDGGMISNNPTIDLLNEVTMWNQACEIVGDKQRKIRIGCMLSIGCGICPPIPMGPSVFEMTDAIGVLKGIRDLTTIVIDQVTAADGAPVNRSRTLCHAQNIPFFRLNCIMHKNVKLDTSDDLDLVSLMWECEVFARKNKSLFQELATLIQDIGTTQERREKLAWRPAE